MAYKRRLSKKKSWTGRELGQLELLNFAHIFEQRQNRRKGQTVTPEETLFNVRTFVDILNELYASKPEEGAIYDGYRKIEQWIGKYYNIAWAYNNIVDLCIGNLHAEVEKMDLLLRVAYAFRTLPESENTSTPMQKAAWSISQIIDGKKLSPPAYDVLNGALDNLKEKFEYIFGTIDGARWVLLNGHEQLTAYAKALELVADRYDVPEIKVFLVSAEEFYGEIDRIVEKARTAKALQAEVQIPEAGDLINAVFDALEDVQEGVKEVPYTPESILRVQSALIGVDGFSLFNDSRLMDMLIEHRVLEYGEYEEKE